MFIDSIKSTLVYFFDLVIELSFHPHPRTRILDFHIRVRERILFAFRFNFYHLIPGLQEVNSIHCGVLQ